MGCNAAEMAEIGTSHAPLLIQGGRRYINSYECEREVCPCFSSLVFPENPSSLLQTPILCLGEGEGALYRHVAAHTTEARKYRLGLDVSNLSDRLYGERGYGTCVCVWVCVLLLL